jgi:hypothetical protein
VKKKMGSISLPDTGNGTWKDAHLLGFQVTGDKISRINTGQA